MWIEAMNNSTFEGSANQTALTTVPATSTDYYIEFTRENNDFTVRLTTSSDYTGGETKSVTLASVTSLRYFGFKARGDTQNNGGNVQGTIKPIIRIYNAVTTATPATWTRQNPYFTASFWAAGGTAAPWGTANYHDTFNGTVWATSTNMSTGVFGSASCGTSSDSMIMGGDGGVGDATTDSRTLCQRWNGSSWSTSTGGTLNTARNFHAGGGKTSEAWVVSGAPTGGGYYTATSENWNGTTWTNSSANIIARGASFGDGSLTEGWVTGGQKATGVSGTLLTTEHYDGTTWSAGASITDQRNSGTGGGFGDRYNSGFVGGTGGSGKVSILSLYNGIAWSTGTSIAQAQSYNTGAGTPQNAMTALGTGNTEHSNSGTYTPKNSQTYNGTSWTITGALTRGRTVGTGGN
jgi:hypothetical protein